MASWDTYDPQVEEQYQRDFVLKQPSIVGPWVVLGLGVILAIFVTYLVYVNMLLPPSVVVFSERIGHSDTTVDSTAVRSKRLGRRSGEYRKAAVTVIPQGRAPNALLGGQGPALPPEQRLAPWSPTPPPSRTATR